MLTRLLILWLLSEQPHHGYRIKKILDEETLYFWFPVEYGSIYAVLRSLVRGGYVEPHAVEREGQRPERTRYAITPAGRTHLQELLLRAWSEIPGPGDAIQLALAARSELTEDEIAERLSERRARLEDRLAELDRLSPSAPAPEMVDRLRALTRAELDWTQALLAQTTVPSRRTAS